jgi:hypothetical protein
MLVSVGDIKGKPSGPVRNGGLYELKLFCALAHNTEKMSCQELENLVQEGYKHVGNAWRVDISYTFVAYLLTELRPS